jgi:hypothetical protein
VFLNEPLVLLTGGTSTWGIWVDVAGDAERLAEIVGGPMQVRVAS